MHASERKWWKMRCFDREQAEDRVKGAQSSALSGIGSLVSRATELDDAAVFLPDDDAADVRVVTAKMRTMIAIAREAEWILDRLNQRRRDREVAQRDEAAQYAAPDIKIEMR